MNTRALLPLMPLLLACTTPATADADTAEDATVGDGDGDSTTGDGDGDSTTGDGDGDPYANWCGLSEGPAEPWFQVYQYNELLEDSSTLAVECGFQGFFMLEIVPQLGGFIPNAEDVLFHVTLDIEGHNDGPNGHFAESDFNIYVACCEEEGEEYNYECYYLTDTFQLFPPDEVSDLSVIHDLPGKLTVSMDGPDGQVEQVVNVQMWAIEQNSEWEFCLPYYPSVEPLPVNGLPIP